MSIKIGYQGKVGSNSEEASKKFVNKLDMKNVELIPLTGSANVVTALQNKEIDYGVVAVENSIGGKVTETQDALRGRKIRVLSVESLDIHHCLFKKNNAESIRTIASHIQALKQTEEYRCTHFPDCFELEVEDTAVAAEMLADGILDDDVAVICRKNAGELNNLELVAENIEDRDDNKTIFIFFNMK